jgi:hypothetical protein
LVSIESGYRTEKEMVMEKAIPMVFISMCCCVSALQGIEFTLDTVIPADDMSFEGQPVTVNACVVTMDGHHAFQSLQVINGGIVTHSAAAASGLVLDIAGDVYVDFISYIDVSGKGYGPADGPGQGQGEELYAAGAGYGGLGGKSQTGAAEGLSYGSVTEPMNFGSGGGTGYGLGASGGGAVYLNIIGNLTVDGEISSNGATTNAWYGGGGGSGGSVRIKTAGLMGAGVISANGGNGHFQNNNAGGGGGGRIALDFDTEEFWGSIYCHGGLGYQIGGAGTIFKRQSGSQFGSLYIDNWHLDGQTTPLKETDTFLDIIPLNYGKLELSEEGQITVLDELRIANEGFAYLQTQQVLPRVHVLSGGRLGHLPMKSGFDLVVTGDVIVEDSGFISGYGNGYPAETGPGKGMGQGDNYGPGGGYGGPGGDSKTGGVPGKIYGSVETPIYFGSGGGNGYGYGGSGGGTIRLTVYGNLVVNGQLDAEGQQPAEWYGGGGGSGGSLYVKANVLGGTGIISVNGGNGHTQNGQAGGGGGGRMALYTGTNNFLGQITAVGGNGYNPGGPGTIHYGTFEFGCGDYLHPHPMGDLSGDCRVDIADFAVIASHWMECTLDGCL